MKTNLHPYARTLDAAPAQKLELPAPVDGQLRLKPFAFFLLGGICTGVAILIASLVILAVWKS